MRAKCCVSGLFFIVSASGAALADDTVVITATRDEQPISGVGQSISVIDAEAIASRQSASVVDLLRTVPGISYTRNGGVGTSTSVYIRGAESDHSVVIIDGVKLNDPSAPGGGFDFGQLLVGNIARIEVLRGAQSVLWGSQAIGGVVNLVTLEPTDELSANARAEYGWRDTRQVVGNVSRRFGPVAISVGAGDFHTDGVSALDEHFGGEERDGYDNFGANAKIDVTLSDAVSLDLRGWYSNGTTEIDGFPAPTFSFADTREYSRTREVVGYSGLNFALLEGRFRNRIATGYTETRRINFDPDAAVTNTFDGEGRNIRYEYQGTFELSDAVRAIFGAETERSRFVTASFGGPSARADARIDSGFAEIVARPLNGLTTIVGARHDKHDEFGGHTSIGASAAWSPNEGRTSYRASYSEGFKAPTLFQLHSEYGNTQVRPETARGWDLGITQRLANETLELGVTVFRRDTRDLVTFVSCFGVTDGICADKPFGTYDNAARARSEGVEVTALLRPTAALDVQAAYSYVDSRNRTAGSVFDRQLVRRPRRTASAIVDYRWPLDIETGLTLTHVGASFDDAANTRKVGSYEVVDLRFGWQVTPVVQLQARVENLLDEEYETVFQYGTAGRAAYAGVRLSY